jgi:hypothetical protein
MACGKICGRLECPLSSRTAAAAAAGATTAGRDSEAEGEGRLAASKPNTIALAASGKSTEGQVAACPDCACVASWCRRTERIGELLWWCMPSGAIGKGGGSPQMFLENAGLNFSAGPLAWALADRIRCGMVAWPVPPGFPGLRQRGAAPLFTSGAHLTLRSGVSDTVNPGWREDGERERETFVSMVERCS